MYCWSQFADFRFLNIYETPSYLLTSSPLSHHSFWERQRTSLHVLSICSVPGGLSWFLLLLFFALFSKHSLPPLIHKISLHHEEPSLAIVRFRHTVWSHNTVLTSAESCFPAWGGWPFGADVGDLAERVATISHEWTRTTLSPAWGLFLARAPSFL